MNHEPEVSVITGGVGSGKSTFVKYLISTNISEFKHRKIAPSRIEYIKFKRYLQEFPEKIITDAKPPKIDHTKLSHEFVCHLKQRLFRDYCLFRYGTVDEAGVAQYAAISDVDQRKLTDELKQVIRLKDHKYVDDAIDDLSNFLMLNVVDEIRALLFAAIRENDPAMNHLVKLQSQLSAYQNRTLDVGEGRRQSLRLRSAIVALQASLIDPDGSRA